METAAKTNTAGHSGPAALHHNAVPDVAPAAEGALPFFGGLPVQAKLEVSPPDDPQEREADNVADAVMRMPEAADAAPVQASPAPGMVQMKCAACEAEETVHRFPEPAVQRENIVQRKCAACEQEEKVQRKCAACEAEETVHRFPEPAVQRENIVQRKCAACEQEERVQRKCAACEAEETVHRFPEPAVTRTGIVQRKCDECQIDKPSGEETKEETEIDDQLGGPDVAAAAAGDGGDDSSGTVSPKANAGGPGPVPSSFESGLQASKGGGQPMAAPLRESMESRFGQDFGHVRIHSNHHAAGLSKSINAQAFTHGSDIYFNQNKYDGTSASGRHLLAHELTHVIQQTGPSAVKPKIQRSDDDRKGNWAHTQLQEKMRATDKQKDLITEAGIPGGVSGNRAVNAAGYADLYKAENNVVSGMQVKIVKGAFDYQAFMESGKHKKAMKGPYKQGPTKKADGSWDFTINFPSKFWIGEIKPLFFAEFGLKVEDMMGSGILQKDNYKEGFREFIEHVHSVFPAATPTATGADLDLAGMIPDSINYDLFDAQHTKKDGNTIFKPNTNQRLWIANLGKGMGGYFLMPHPYIPTEFVEDKKKHRARLDGLIKKLRETGGKPKMPPSIAKKAEPGKTTTKVQRNKNDNADAVAWENDRRGWASGADTSVPQKPKKFVKERGQGLLKRHKVDKKLKKTTPDPIAKDISDVKDIRFWSSFKGRVYGALRFRFRKVFEKVEELFQKIKTKFEKHREASKKLKGGDGFEISWKKEAVNLIVKLAVDIFQKMIVIAYEGFAKCMDTIVDAVIDKYQKALEGAMEEQLKEMEPVCCIVMEFKHKWDAEVEKHDKTIETFTLTVDKMREWTAILDKVEMAVRLGVQIISCGTPPGVGCLWGLVAQLGVSAGMSLLQKTDYWQNNIARPAAQALMDAIVGDKLHNLMISVMKDTPLGPFMGAQACQPRQKGSGGGVGAIGEGLDKIDPNDPAIAKARAEWEAEKKDEIMADLKEFFESGEKGKPLTPEEIQKLVEAIKKSGKKPEELKKMIEEGRNAKTGKVDITKAFTSVTSGTVPADKPAKERKIDYEKAKKNNLYFFNMLKWLPTLFIKKPGIQPGSAEFADAVYDLQEALGMPEPDGIAGPGTTQKFYFVNGLEKDKVFKAAVEMEERAKQDKEMQKALEEAKKQRDEILNNPRVKEELAKPYPSRDELKKVMTSGNWDAIEAGGYRIVKRTDGSYFVVFRSFEGAVIGAFLKTVEWELDGEKVNKIVQNGEFYAVTEVPKMDGLGLSSRDPKAPQDMMDDTYIIALQDGIKADNFHFYSRNLLFGFNLRK